MRVEVFMSMGRPLWSGLRRLPGHVADETLMTTVGVVGSSSRCHRDGVRSAGEHRCSSGDIAKPVLLRCLWRLPCGVDPRMPH